MSKRIKIGECGVDSGQIMLADPCYVLTDERDVGKPNEKPHIYSSIKGYMDMLDKYDDINTDTHQQIGDGTAVVVSGFGGDGVFPVYANINDQGMVTSVTIEFR